MGSRIQEIHTAVYLILRSHQVPAVRAETARVRGVGDRAEVSVPSRNFNPLSNGVFREE